MKRASQLTYTIAEGESSSILPQRTERVDSTPHDVYRLYSSGELVGVLSSRRELDAFLRSIYQELYAEQYPGSEVGLGTDVYLISEQSYMTYENIDTQIFDYLKENRLFTLKCTGVELSDENGVYAEIYVSDEELFNSAMTEYMTYFIAPDELAILNRGDSTPQLKTYGSRSIGVTVLQTITMKETFADPDYIPRLFEPFTQEDNDNTSRYGGSGLGMAISKSFVEMMDGEITVTSEKGTGSTFTVAVSLGRVRHDDMPEQEASGNAPPDEAALQGCHVLIAEDQAINAEVLTDLLELEGISSEWAENGRLAVDLFAGSEEGHFAAILMDMRMPVLDGLEATREIRKLSRPDAAAIPIIALSANAFEDDVKQCLEAGINAHLSKPVDMERLKAVLAELIAPSEG